MTLGFVFIALIFAAMFSAEGLVTTIVGGLLATGLTQWLKKGTGLQGAGATVLAIIVSFVVGAAAFVVSSVISGNQLGWEMIPAGATQIFALATIAYNLMIKSGAESL